MSVASKNPFAALLEGMPSPSTPRSSSHPSSSMQMTLRVLPPPRPLLSPPLLPPPRLQPLAATLRKTVGAPPPVVAATTSVVVESHLVLVMARMET